MCWGLGSTTAPNPDSENIVIARRVIGVPIFFPALSADIISFAYCRDAITWLILNVFHFHSDAILIWD